MCIVNKDYVWKKTYKTTMTEHDIELQKSKEIENQISLTLEGYQTSPPQPIILAHLDHHS